ARAIAVGRSPTARRSTPIPASATPGWWCRCACAAAPRNWQACCIRSKAARRDCSSATSTSSPSACTSAPAGPRQTVAMAGWTLLSTCMATSRRPWRLPVRLDDAGPRSWLLAGIAGWALAAWLLALAGMGGRVEPLADDPALLKPLPPVRPAPALRLGPPGQYEAIATRPLFSADRKPQPFFLQGEGDAVEQ